ncbi:MAG: chemotaxis protein CheD [Planctomycetota bacterium]
MAAGQQAAANVVVGVADLAVVNAKEGVIRTFALGSCIGITVWDPRTHAGGLLHFMLAEPGEDAPVGKPAMYATTGIPLLFSRMAEFGVPRDRLVVCAAGGAEILADSGLFTIGKRNRTTMRRIFWKDGTKLSAEDTGGDHARNLSLDLSTGAVSVRVRGTEKVLWAPAGMERT